MVGVSEGRLVQWAFPRVGWSVGVSEGRLVPEGRLVGVSEGKLEAFPRVGWLVGVSEGRLVGGRFRG